MLAKAVSRSPIIRPDTWQPEVLAPAGSPACLEAAVAGGAHAVYMGLRHFNARGRAENFRQADLARYVSYLHHHGVKCYVVFNTLLHDDEIAKAVPMAEQCYQAGVDALIIQDLGLWQVLAELLPDLPRHASTQMTIHEPAQIDVLAELGAERVILARELSLAELDACTQRADSLGVETEHFVHGALCYAYSGQCLMSNFAGCRSANRGTCAQNCRFDYHVDGEDGLRTEISMRDFSAVGQIAELANIGVASLKIEGRLKEPAYVYTTSKMYRAAVDAWAAGKTFSQDEAERTLRTVFSRPFTATPLAGVYDEQARLSRWNPQEDRQVDATIESVDRKKQMVWLRAKKHHVPSAGCGYDFTVDDFNGGFLITGIDQKQSTPKNVYACRVRIDKRGPHIPVGLPVFCNTDHSTKRQANDAMAQVRLEGFSQGGLAVSAELIAHVGEPLALVLRANNGTQCTVTADYIVEAATGRPLDEAQAHKALGAMGGSGYELSDLKIHMSAPCFVPAGQLKALRRAAIERLAEQPVPQPVHWAMPLEKPVTPRATELWVAVDNRAAAEAALAAGVAQVWFDDPQLDWSSVASVQAAVPEVLLASLSSSRSAEAACLRCRHSDCIGAGGRVACGPAGWFASGRGSFL